MLPVYVVIASVPGLPSPKNVHRKRTLSVAFRAKVRHSPTPFTNPNNSVPVDNKDCVIMSQSFIIYDMEQTLGEGGLNGQVPGKANVTIPGTPTLLAF